MQSTVRRGTAAATGWHICRRKHYCSCIDLMYIAVGLVCTKRMGPARGSSHRNRLPIPAEVRGPWERLTPFPTWEIGLMAKNGKSLFVCPAEPSLDHVPVFPLVDWVTERV